MSLRGGRLLDVDGLVVGNSGVRMGEKMRFSELKVDFCSVGGDMVDWELQHVKPGGGYGL